MTTLQTPDTIAYAALWIDLGRARTALAEKDTPANRAEVQRCLDLFDEQFDDRPRPTS